MKAALFLAAALWLAAMAHAAPSSRVVALGGDVTEIVYALGAESGLVCDDQTSLYPEAATKLPQVGYLRTLGAEGVLSCRPDLILASADAGPAAVVSELEASGVRFVRVTNAHSPDAVLAKIETVAKALGAEKEGEALQSRYRAGLAAEQGAIAAKPTHPRALFLMAQGAGVAMAAGHGSAADAMLTLAGAENVAGFDGYKPLTAEAAVALKPDVIIIGARAAAALGGIEAVRARPEIALTPAGQQGRIVAIDELLLLGFGLRTPEALVALDKALRP